MKVAPLLVLFLLGEPGLSSARPGGAAARVYRYHPRLRPPSSLESIYQHLTPGKDAFPAEKETQELAARLNELGAILREHPGRVQDATDLLLAPEFKGGRLVPASEVSLGNSARLEIFRASAMPADLVRDRASFRGELLALIDEFQAIRVAELLITAIDVPREPDPLVRTVVRFDIVGPGKKAWRAERLGQWQMRWRRGADGVWRVAEWIALDHLRSHASDPVFTEVTEAAFGANPSFRRQLVPASITGPRPSTRSSRRGAWATTGCRWATSTATAWRTSTSPSPKACPTGSSATRATAPSRTRPRPRASRSSTAPRRRSSRTWTTMATRT